MKLRALAGAALIALAPIAASAATTVYDGRLTGDENNYVVRFDADNDVNSAGLFDLDLGDLSYQAFFVQGLSEVSGMISFMVQTGLGGSGGSLNVNLTGISLGDVSGTFGGQAIQFVQVEEDLVAKLYTSTSPATFELNFSGASAGDNIQLDLAAVPIPAAGFLLLAGLGGLAAVRRRKTA